MAIFCYLLFILEEILDFILVEMVIVFICTFYVGQKSSQDNQGRNDFISMNFLEGLNRLEKSFVDLSDEYFSWFSRSSPLSPKELFSLLSHTYFCF